MQRAHEPRAAQKDEQRDLPDNQDEHAGDEAERQDPAKPSGLALRVIGFREYLRGDEQRKNVD